MERTPRIGQTQNGSVSRLKAVGIGRVSAVGERDPERATTAPEQRAWFYAECERLDFEPAGYFEDLNVQGVVWDRPGLQTALATIAAGDAEMLLVMKQSRLARDPELVLRAERIVREAGGQVHYGDVGTDKLLRLMVSGMTQRERDDRNDNFEMSKNRAVDAGKYLAKTPPFGYRWANEEDVLRKRAKVCKQLVVFRSEAKVIRELFEMRAAGKSWSTLALHFEKRTGSQRALQTIQHMLANRAYLGESHYKENVNENAHEPIVTPELYAVANKRAEGRPRPDAKRLLSGFARCTTCGSSMAGDGVLYRCSNRTFCKAPASLKADTLEAIVKSDLWGWLENVAGAERSYVDQVDEQRLSDARLAVEAAIAEEHDWAVSSVGLSREAVAAGSAARAAATAERRRELAAIEAEDTLAGARITLRQLWPTLTGEEFRSVVADLGLRVSVQRGRRGAGDPADRVQTFLGGGSTPLPHHARDSGV